MSRYRLYYAAVLVGVLLCAVYPLIMGVSVIADMISIGTVIEEHFPKYIIPYTPLAIAVIVSTAAMPLFIKNRQAAATAGGCLLGTAVFLAAEWFFESKVIVTSTVTTTLESWQMYMCYIPPAQTYTRQWTAVDVLMGEYSPTFKLHFYLIAIVLMIAIVRVIYGFGYALYHRESRRLKALTVQAVCTVSLLAMCILACFTAFFRDGELTVKPLSAVLMAVFFILLGVTAGVFVGSLLLEKRRAVSVGIPSLTASLVTLLMYIGETFLLSGHLYRLGDGAFFTPKGSLPFAPIDIVIIIAAGAVTALIMQLLQPRREAVA